MASKPTKPLRSATIYAVVEIYGDGSQWFAYAGQPLAVYDRLELAQERADQS